MPLHLSKYIDKIAVNDGSLLAENWRLVNVKQINLFIGPNNSGKSREIRELFNSKIHDWNVDNSFLPTSLVIKGVYNSLEDRDFVRSIRTYVNSNVIQDIKNNKDSLLNSSSPMSLSNIVDYLVVGATQRINGTTISYIQQKIIDPIIKNFDSEGELDELTTLPTKFLYIPTLRSLRNLGEKDTFYHRTLADYFGNNIESSKSIFTGHSLYNDLVEHLLGSHEQRSKVREYEEYLSVNFFFGQPISLVPMVKKDVVYFKEGDKEERPIYDLGDGIQSIIILTFPIFMAERETLFFIEEPEHYLHAGLQRTLIETISMHKEHIFFMTTHSNHFLDLAQERSDISIQQVSQKEGKTVVESVGEYGNLINDLGIRASSVLLANCSIWVEGVTDKLYLRAYMTKYISELEQEGKVDGANKLKSYHENLHYVFTEYQGSNITHWDFSDNSEGDGVATPARKMNKNILLIADADINGKGSRVSELTDDLGDNFCLLKWKEIENYIPHKLLIKTANKRWDTFTQRKDCSNERFANIAKDKFESVGTGIGEILERYVDKPAPKPKAKIRNFYKADSGTIKDKVKFCHTAIAEMNDEDNTWSLTPELNKLCKKLWEHVIENN